MVARMKTTPSGLGKAEAVRHVPVASSSIASAGYRVGEELLEVRFRSGAVYRYLKVPPAVHDAFMAAQSKGRYFNEVIRGHFAYGRS